MEKSTKLKIAAGGIFSVTILGTIITIFLFPPAAPFIATLGSAAAAAAGKEVIARLFNRLRERFGSPDLEVSPIPEFQYRQWSRLTEDQKISASGNHLTQTTTVERKMSGAKPKLML